MRRLTFAFALGACAAMSSPALAEPASASGNARILRQINFALLLELDFGTVVASPSGGTIILDPVSSSRDCSNGALVCSGSYSIARLHLTGSDAMVTVTYAPTLTLTGPGQPMVVRPLFPGGSGAQVQLVGGAADFDFGAELDVNPAQASGDYSGTFVVNVDYS